MVSPGCYLSWAELAHTRSSQTGCEAGRLTADTTSDDPLARAMALFTRDGAASAMYHLAGTSPAFQELVAEIVGFVNEPRGSRREGIEDNWRESRGLSRQSLHFLRTLRSMTVGVAEQPVGHLILKSLSESGDGWRDAPPTPERIRELQRLGFPEGDFGRWGPGFTAVLCRALDVVVPSAQIVVSLSPGGRYSEAIQALEFHEGVVARYLAGASHSGDTPLIAKRTHPLDVLVGPWFEGLYIFALFALGEMENRARAWPAADHSERALQQRLAGSLDRVHEIASGPRSFVAASNGLDMRWNGRQHVESKPAWTPPAQLFCAHEGWSDWTAGAPPDTRRRRNLPGSRYICSGERTWFDGFNLVELAALMGTYFAGALISSVQAPEAGGSREAGAGPSANRRRSGTAPAPVVTVRPELSGM